jgi:solute carrier family 8 (sodium/calcium exchanger)
MDCHEDIGRLTIVVHCDRVNFKRADRNCVVKVDYATVELTAKAGSEFEAAVGTLEFGTKETAKNVHVSIINNDAYRDESQFKLQLANVRIEMRGKVRGHSLFGVILMTHLQASNNKVAGENAYIKCVLGTPNACTVTVIDNDHGGVFEFTDGTYGVTELNPNICVTVVRGRGARGKVRVPYTTVDGSAHADVDYLRQTDTLTFIDGQAE